MKGGAGEKHGRLAEQTRASSRDIHRSPKLAWPSPFGHHLLSLPMHRGLWCSAKRGAMLRPPPRPSPCQCHCGARGADLHLLHPPFAGSAASRWSFSARSPPATTTFDMLPCAFCIFRIALHSCYFFYGVVPLLTAAGLENTGHSSAGGKISANWLFAWCPGLENSCQSSADGKNLDQALFA